MSRALAGLASRYVGRRVRLVSGPVGTITRVSRRGLHVTLDPVLASDVAEYLDD